MKKYENLIFDLDDTLINNRENIKHAFKKLLEQLKIAYKQEEFERFYQLDNEFWQSWQERKREIPKQYFVSKQMWKDWLRARRFQLYFHEQISLETASKMNSQYIELLKEQVISIPGAKETIRKLAKQYNIIVATNGPLLAVEAKLEKIQIKEYVTMIFSAEQVGAMKPDNRFYEGIFERLQQWDKTKYLAIGDSILSDIRGANRIGIDSCWLNLEKKENKTKDIPTIEIHALEELVKMI